MRPNSKYIAPTFLLAALTMQGSTPANANIGKDNISLKNAKPTVCQQYKAEEQNFYTKAYYALERLEIAWNRFQKRPTAHHAKIYQNLVRHTQKTYGTQSFGPKQIHLCHNNKTSIYILRYHLKMHQKQLKDIDKQKASAALTPSY